MAACAINQPKRLIPAIKQFSDLKLSLKKLQLGEGSPYPLMAESLKSISGEATQSTSQTNQLLGYEVDSECKTEGDDEDLLHESAAEAKL